MNDDFLQRIRVDPPPHFIASLKARLAQLEHGMQPRPVWRRGLFLGSLIAATALASGLFLARRMYDVSSSAVPPSHSPSVSSPTIDDGPRAVSPLPTGQAKSSVVP